MKPYKPPFDTWGLLWMVLGMLFFFPVAQARVKGSGLPAPPLKTPIFPGGFHTLPALAFALLAELPQFLPWVLKPVPHPQPYLVSHCPEPLQHGVVGEVLLAAKIPEKVVPTPG